MSRFKHSIVPTQRGQRTDPVAERTGLRVDSVRSFLGGSPTSILCGIVSLTEHIDTKQSLRATLPFLEIGH